MNLLIRCLWLPTRDASLESRFAEIADIGRNTHLVTKLGPRWFKLGHSRRDALKNEVHFGEMYNNEKLCRRVQLVDGKAYWILDVWNGRPEEEGANVHFRLYDPPLDLDTFLISFEHDLSCDFIPWNDIVSTAQRLAELLGAYVIVRSDRLLKLAKQRNIANAEYAAYAAFWGVDRSGRNPMFRWLANTGAKAPSAILACNSREEVDAPDDVRLRKITESLAAVAAEVGDKATA